MRKVFFSSVAILLIVFWLGCGGENPLEEYSDGNIQIEVEKVEVVPPSSPSGIFIEVFIYLELTNLNKETVLIEESDFSLQDIRGSIIHHTQGVVLFDPTVESNPTAREAYYQYLLGHHDKPIRIFIKPRDKIFVGLSSVYRLDDQKGEWHLVYGNETKFPVQGMINEAITAEEERRMAQLRRELAQIDIENINLREYFPLAVGSRWVYEETNGELREVKIFEKKSIGNWEIFKSLDPGWGDYDTFAFNPIKNEIAHIWGWPPGDYFYLRLRTYITPDTIIGKEIVTTPAGDFSCIKVKRQDYPRGTLLEWYAKGIGMVKREYLESSRCELLIEYDEI